MMDILIIGAGKSSGHLIDYLIEHTKQFNNKVIVADNNINLAKEKVNNAPNAIAVEINLENSDQRRDLVSKAFLVVSMLPADLHPLIAKDCLELKKHFFTASYVSNYLNEIKSKVEENDLFFLNECGLDPGIDHMSAMKIIDVLKEEGHEITSFKSYCGGLVAPESNDNPWGYKFSWNPRNVILAGAATAQYLDNNEFKFIPPHRLFKEFKNISIPNHGEFDGYANRDSLGYRTMYGLENVSTMLRGTLRSQGFCEAWNIFVQMGFNTESFEINTQGKTYKEISSSLIPGNGEIKNRISDLCNINVNSNALKMVEWTGILSDEIVPFDKATPAKILQELLERKWLLKPSDKDMIVMQHLFESRNGNVKKQISSSLICIGQNSAKTAMSKTVGLPLAIAVKLFLQGDIRKRGVLTPVTKEFYLPILKELETYDIKFAEEEKIIS